MPTPQQKEREREKTRALVKIGMAAALVIFRGMDPDEALDAAVAFGEAAEARHPGWIVDLCVDDQ